jgi:uncharacterized protein YraI
MKAMRRRAILLAVALLGCCTLGAQSMKMVVDTQGRAVGRYLFTNATTYTIAVQDTGEVPKIGHRVVTFRAEDGQGIVYRDPRRTGNINVRKGPSTSYPVVGKIAESDGVPETFPCLGKVNGWYKLRLGSVIGYVREDLLCWDGMDTF